MQIFRHLAATLVLVAMASGLHAEETDPDTKLTPRYKTVLGVGLDPLGGMLRQYYCHDKSRFIWRPYTLARMSEGVLVKSTMEGTSARKVGLRCGDMVVAIDGTPTPYAETLQKHVTKWVWPGQQVRLTILRPQPVWMGDDGRTRVKHTRLEIDVAASRHDLVAAAVQAPLSKNLNLEDGFGPRFHARSESTIIEHTPGWIRYWCMLSHEGDQDVLEVESRELSLLGYTALEPMSLARGTTKVFRHVGNVKTDGIPVRVKFNIGLARSFNSKYVKDHINRYGGTAHNSNREGRWHSWMSFDMECWLPEKQARLIEARQKRLRQSGK